MADFDEKLNTLLSDPNAMAQIMHLAQSLGGNQEMTPSQNCQPEASPAGSTSPSHTTSQRNDPLTSLLGDPSLLLKLMPLMQELSGQNHSNAKALLYALRPYLKPERQDKVERALQLARLFHIGKKFLAGWEG